MLNKIFEMIQLANPGRDFASMGRRLLKVVEEIGESSEAYLNITSNFNGKGKTSADLREEMVDALIVIVDCLFTKLPGEENMSTEEIEDEIVRITAVKLQKWADNKKRQVTAVDDAV